MLEIDGVCYAGSPDTEDIEIVDVIPCEGRMLICTFSNGQRRLFDTTILAEPVFEPLDNPGVFHSVRIDYGTLTWADGEIDVAPEYVFANSLPYNTDEVVSAA